MVPTTRRGFGTVGTLSNANEWCRTYYPNKIFILLPTGRSGLLFLAHLSGLKKVTWCSLIASLNFDSVNQGRAGFELPHSS